MQQRKPVLASAPAIFTFVMLTVGLSCVVLIAKHGASHGAHCLHQASVSRPLHQEVPTAEVGHWVLAVAILLQLVTISFSYGRIVYHVTQKFFRFQARSQFLFYDG